GPQTLEVVVPARFLEEHVHHDVAVVEQYPPGVVESLHAVGASGSGRLGALLDLLGDGSHLAGVATTGDDEGIGDGQERAHLQDDRGLALLVGGGSSRKHRQRPGPVGPVTESAPESAQLLDRAHLPPAYRPRWRMRRTAGSGTRKSRGRPLAARARRSVLEMSSPGISTTAKRSGAGVTARACFCQGWLATTNSTRSRPRAWRALTAATR